MKGNAMSLATPSARPASPSETPATGRIQLALNVTDLAQSVEFYTNLFGQAPTKVRDGYANFAIAEPPLKLILFAGTNGGTINHLGVEVGDADQVSTAIGRMQDADMDLDIEEQVTCCYATQSKAWATAPDGERWEYYTVLADAEQLEPSSDARSSADDSCCSEPAVGRESPCCEPTA